MLVKNANIKWYFASKRLFVYAAFDQASEKSNTFFLNFEISFLI